VTSDWGGAQWVLATWIVLSVIAPPILRAGLMQRGYTPETDNAHFIGKQVSHFTIKAVLVAILYWGDFW
jgi:hypothetical protein